MRALITNLGTASRALSYLLGVVVVVLAVAVASGASGPADIAHWANRVFGPVFILILGGLVLTALFCWQRMLAAPGEPVWLEAGLQAADGITTLALMYTLLGISLGIGTLAEQDLTPTTVRTIIRALTANFSLAFMTTVVGLPVATVLRTLLLVSHAHGQRLATLYRPGETEDR